MHEDNVRIFFEANRSWVVRGCQVQYLGTDTGTHSFAGNVERYSVSYQGHEMEGTWDGDARNPIEVVQGVPTELAADLKARWQRDVDARDRADREAALDYAAEVEIADRRRRGSR